MRVLISVYEQDPVTGERVYASKDLDCEAIGSFGRIGDEYVLNEYHALMNEVKQMVKAKRTAWPKGKLP